MSTYKTPELTEVEVTGSTRGAFLLRATMSAGAILGTGALSPFVTGALAQGGKGDVDILNYALTLEYLEAGFYARALDRVNMSREVRTLAEEIGSNEDEHVDALKAAIESAGGTPIKKPGLSFGGAFANEKTFLRFANIFEDTGVSAYNGAAPMIRSKEILAAAGSIVQIEGRHAALIRLQRNKPPAPLAFDKASSMEEVVKAVKPFLS
ncbi:MAG: ferritin-like domain-containing protein [Solirubrobacterales bacterium]|nr:ferritin-like domain-containing protein [Solirubrobacterales bacterium]